MECGGPIAGRDRVLAIRCDPNRRRVLIADENTPVGGGTSPRRAGTRALPELHPAAAKAKAGVHLKPWWPQIHKAGRGLIGAGEGQELRVLIKVAEESNAERCTGSTDAVVVAGVDRRWFRSILASDTIWNDDRGMSAEIGDR